MLSVMPVGASVRLFFPLVVAQLFVVLPRSRIIASAAYRIRPEVNLAVLDHSPYNLFLRDVYDAVELCRSVRHLQLEPGGCECFLGLQSLVHRHPQLASTINNPDANIAGIPMRLSHSICCPPFSCSGPCLAKLNRERV